MRSLLLLLGALVALGSSAVAQLPDDLGPPAHEHSAMAAPMIDGSKNPELIPDSTAYRLFFVSVAESANPTPEETARHKAHLSRTGLKDSDKASLTNVLKEFKAQYSDLIKNYNDAAQVALLQGQAPDYGAFLRQRDALVQSTRDKLKLALTPEGMTGLDAFVQGEKHKMKIQQAQ
jgi:hypothetical protein